MADTTAPTNSNNNNKENGAVESKVTTCPDGHSCENGSFCVENAHKEGQFFCDCDDSQLAGVKVFTGLYCQHEATVFCTETGEYSKVGFCANEGTCLGFINKVNHTHVGCECPPGYTGKHCQFVEGSVPEGYPLENSNMNELASNESPASSTGTGTAGIIVIVLSILVVMGLLGKVLMIVLRRRRQLAETHVVEQTKSSDGNLHDPDGENLELPAPKTFESDDTDLQPSESAEMA